MGWLSWFKATPKIAEDVVEGGIAGIDKLFFTDEEKSDASQKLYGLWLETQKVVRDENTVRSVTRRFLACMIMGEYLLFLLMAVICWPLMPEWSKSILIIAGMLTNLVIAVAIFYFGPYAFSAYIKKKE